MSLLPSPIQTETRSDSRTPLPPKPQASPRRLSWFRLRSQRSATPLPTVPTKPTIYAFARPRRMKRLGRRLTLWSLVIYALLAVHTNMVMMSWCPDLAERVHRVKWPRLQEVAKESAGRPFIVSLGSSRMDAAFQSGRVNGLPTSDGRRLAAYNFAIPSAGPLHEYQYVRDMLDAGIRPNALVVEVLPPLFAAPHRNRYIFSEETWGVPDWMSLHQFCLMHPYFQNPGRKLGHWIEARIAPASVYRRALQGFIEWQVMPPQKRCMIPYINDLWGCRIPPLMRDLEHEACVNMARDYIPSLANFRLGDGPPRALYDMLELCRREHIDVVLVLMPESSVFRSWYRKDCLETMDRLLKEVHQKTGVAILDARLWLDDGDFTDGHHPQAVGAWKFTNRLLTEMTELQKKGYFHDNGNSG